MRGVKSEEGGYDAMIYIYREIQASFKDIPDSDAQVRTQLSREYGEVWEQVWEVEKSGKPHPKLKPMKRGEIEQALVAAKALSRFPEQLRNFEPGKGKVVRSFLGASSNPSPAAEFAF